MTETAAAGAAIPVAFNVWSLEMCNIVFFDARANDRVIVIVIQVSWKFVIITFWLFDLQVKTLVQSVYIEHVQRIPFIIRWASSEIKRIVHGIY